MAQAQTFMPQTFIPGVAYPIIQAPMAGVSTPGLAAAVSNAGGLGSLGIAASSLADARRAIAATQALTSRPFNVNVFCHRPAQRDAVREAAWLSHLAPLFAEFGAVPPGALEEYYPTFTGNDAATAMLLEMRPAVVSFHFGLPAASQLSALRAAGIRTMTTATSAAEAALVAGAGVDMIVAQGYEAGGHRGVFDPDGADACLPMIDLLAQLTRSSPIPVVAAGGIMTGQDVRRVLDLGAVAAQLGTAFVACPESAAGAAYRRALSQPGEKVTAMTCAISGRPARGLANRLTRHGAAPGAPRPAGYPVAYDAAKQLNAVATAGGDSGFGAWWAGQEAGRARAMPAADLVRTLVAEMAG